MASPGMSFGNTVSTALFFVSYVTGITNTDSNYAEHAVYNLADVAHIDMHGFGSAIRSMNDQWYSEGMQLFAFRHIGTQWERRVVTWAVMNYSIGMSKRRIEATITSAFRKWAAVIPFTFLQVWPHQQPDIRFVFKALRTTLKSMTTHVHGEFFDHVGGVTIEINKAANWTHQNHECWCNLRYAVLHEIGHALGLFDSENPRAVMSQDHQRFTETRKPVLEADDIDGVQALYGGPLEGQAPNSSSDVSNSSSDDDNSRA